MAVNVIVPHSLDDYFQSTPIGSLDKAIGDNLYGINHGQVPSAVPSNKDLAGFTFFVRPQLNMQTDNIRNIRQMAALLNNQPLSIQNYVRCMLDPRQQTGYKFNNTKVSPRDCPVVDDMSPFITVLTNNINSISGWPDVTVPVYTSTPGLFNETQSMVDGLARNFEAFSVDASFRNTRGDPILYLFYIWLHYMALVFEGKLVPYLDMITENEIDYNTRIFRITLDRQRNKITKIFSTIAVPVSVPTSAFADYNSERPYLDQNRDITIRFQCNGFETFDDILIKEFNNTVQIFAPDMKDQYRDRNMIKLLPALQPMFKNRGLPRIDPATYELEWWVTRDLFDSRTSAFLGANLINDAQAAAINDTETGD